MQRKMLSAALFLIMMTGVCAGVACAGEYSVFGPAVFERGKGKPVAETAVFECPSPGGVFTLTVVNGDAQGESRVPSASVTLNGEEVAGPSDFSQQAGEIVRDVSLTASNELSVITDGAPGSFITVKITGISLKPSVVFSASPETVQAGESAVLTWRAENAESCAMEPGIGDVPLDGSLTVTPSETTAYTLTAANASGTASAEAVVTVLHPAPTVGITADPESVHAGEPVTLTWTSADAVSAVMDQGVGEVPVSGSRIVYPTVTTTYHITVTGPGGTSAAEITVNALSPITLEITSPAEGETVGGSTVLVKGTVSNLTGAETGVTVNGVTAMIHGNAFAANNVPVFQEGEYMITAGAEDENGNTASQSVTVMADYAGFDIRLEVSPEAGGAPMEATLEAEWFMLPESVSDASVEYAGPGPVTVVKNDPKRFTLAFSMPGLYTLTYAAADGQGGEYRRDIAVNVYDINEMDMFFRDRWDGMRQALLNGDTEKAAGYFMSDRREAYTAVFAVLPAPEIIRIPGAEAIEMAELSGMQARYAIGMETVINGQPETVGSWLIFRKDTNGLWRIVFF